MRVGGDRGKDILASLRREIKKRKGLPIIEEDYAESERPKLHEKIIGGDKAILASIRAELEQRLKSKKS